MKDIPCVLHALIHNGQPLAPQQPQPRVPWWSFTKTVLCAATLTLVRDGLLGLDEPLPQGPFTLRQLLRHQAGLADYSELSDYHDAVLRNEDAWPGAQMLQRLDARCLRYAPGSQWRYSNVGYLFVAQLIQQATDLPLHLALQQRVLAPLGLSRTRLAVTREDLRDVDLGQLGDYHPGWVYHGLLVGPLAEAVLLLDRLLSGALLPPALLAGMQQAQVLGGPMAGRPWVAPGYAMGLMVGSVESGLTLYGHTGSGPGSTLAVYRANVAGTSACCAVFNPGSDQGQVETRALAHLRHALAN
ncbi:serine hydrolase domain-containing protein [Pseudomonas protegens]|uniref:serine hydrolase domain-containing protein n=1 Tax=Pseudomonas protegens TaxID=380021 RepID=UPI0023EE793B|nr:serine hydrolase domain-containing protein [Pseudomonas protegens]